MEVSCEVMDGWERRAWCGESFLSISCAWFYRLAVQLRLNLAIAIATVLASYCK